MADEVQQTPVVETPAVVDPPANETPNQKYERLYGRAPEAQATPVVAQLPPEVMTTLQTLTQEVQNLKAQKPQAQQVEPSKLAWVEKIRQGDFDGAQQSLLDGVVQSIQPKLQEVRQQAYTDALNAAQVNSEVALYLQDIRAKNPDILPFEKYLNGPVTERIQLAQQARRINSPSDFLREYKAAVADEVVNLRNLSLQFRAAGKDEALTRTSDVSRSTTLNPQQVQSTQQMQSADTQNTQGESTDDYFTRRAAESARRRGLS